MQPSKEQFLKDVIAGLSKQIKRISSKYFYDSKGDKIFQEIMELDEYYLPKAELEIIRSRTKDIIEEYPYEKFNVVELGAGDGTKTVHFLDQLMKVGKDITYFPLDISTDVLKVNSQLMSKTLPGLNIKPIPGDYFKTLSNIEKEGAKIILFMGGNIGNYENEEAIKFLGTIKENMSLKDLLMVGIDLQKNPQTILNAYNDSKGVTKRFNLNLLERINRELQANFNISGFDHYATYNPLNGIAYSFLVSLEEQIVKIGNHEVYFREGEVIHTEVSQKYDLVQIENMRAEVGFNTVNNYLDSRGYFSISVFQL